MIEEATINEATVNPEDAVLDFWYEHGKNTVIHAAKTDVVIAPKPLVGEWVNPEITKQLIQKILSQLSSREIGEERVMVTPVSTKLFDGNGTCLVDIPTEPLVDKISNRVTDRIGFELSQREDSWGELYLTPRDDGHYTFGDVMNPVIKFLGDQGIRAGNNPLRDIIRYFIREKKQGKGNLN